MIKNTLINMMRQLKFKNRKEIGIIMLIKRITKNNFKFMKEIGKTIFSTAKVQKLGNQELNIQVTSSKDKKPERVNLVQREIYMKVILLMVNFKVKENTYLQKQENITQAILVII
jgi:hypothetical protein